MTEQLEAFLAFLRLNRNVSPHTVARVRERPPRNSSFTWRPRLPRTASVRRQLSTVRRFAAFSAKLHQRGFPGQRRARKLAAVRTFLRYLRREALIEADPAALVRRRGEMRMPSHLSEDEMSRSLAAAEDVSRSAGATARSWSSFTRRACA